jgi:hypothetical protein
MTLVLNTMHGPCDIKLEYVGSGLMVHSAMSFHVAISDVWTNYGASGPSLCLDVTLRVLILSYRRFGTAYVSHLNRCEPMGCSETS